MAVTETHEEKNTFQVEVNLPGHAPRGSATPLFGRSRLHLIEREGVHGLPEPVWLAQRYGKEGYKFSDVEIIHHEQGV